MQQHDKFNLKIKNVLLPIIIKYFPTFIVIDESPFSIALETTIGEKLTENKSIWCKCLKEMYSICEKDTGIHGLQNYFNIFLGENSKIGRFVIKDEFYLQNLDKEIINLWKKVNSN